MWGRHTVSELEVRALSHLRDMDLKMLIFDEVHNLLAGIGASFRAMHGLAVFARIVDPISLALGVWTSQTPRRVVAKNPLGSRARKENRQGRVAAARLPAPNPRRFALHLLPPALRQRFRFSETGAFSACSKTLEQFGAGFQRSSP